MNEVIVFHKIFNKIYFSFPSVRRGIQSEMEKYINLLIKHKGEKTVDLKTNSFCFFKYHFDLHSQVFGQSQL